MTVAGLKSERAAAAQGNPSEVLLIGNFLSAEGGNRAVCEELAERLARAGWRVTCTSHVRNRLLRLGDMLRTVFMERSDYAVAQVDVFSGPSFLWAELACWLLRRLGRPYVVTLHGGNLPAFAGRRPRRVARLLSSARAATAPSRYLVEAMRPYRADILELPNAVDLACYEFKLRQHCEPRLIWLRAFHRIYRPQMAVRAAALVRRQAPEVTLTMVGPDKGDGSLEETRQLAVALGIADRVTFVPGVPKAEVPRWLQRGDIFLNTSQTDNAPVSVVEAMACGLCVASTDAGGLRHLLDSGQDGLLVPSEDAEAMAEAVLRILQDQTLAQRLSGSARRKVERMDWSVILPRWEALLRDVTERTAG